MKILLFTICKIPFKLSDPTFIGSIYNMDGTDYWELLLQAEDEGQELIREALAEAKEITDSRREEANAEVERLRQEYTQDLQDKTKEAEQLISELKEDLANDEKTKKMEAAAAVRSVKDQIIETLLHAVLTVPIE